MVKCKAIVDTVTLDQIRDLVAKSFIFLDGEDHTITRLCDYYKLKAFETIVQ